MMDHIVNKQVSIDSGDLLIHLAQQKAKGCKRLQSVKKCLYHIYRDIKKSLEKNGGFFMNDF